MGSLSRIKANPCGCLHKSDHIERLESDPGDGYIKADDWQAVANLMKKQKPTSKFSAKRINWQFIEKLGQGSFGSVSLGIVATTGLYVAAKEIDLKAFLQTKHVRSQGKIAKLTLTTIRYEINCLKRLRHENIIQYYGYALMKQKLMIFLEYACAGSLAEHLQKEKGFSEAVIQQYLKQILNGLAYLHANNFVHRDIKCCNILLNGNGICKLCDFGSSQRVDESIIMPSKGTPTHMAPEVARSEPPTRLGCTIVEMTGNVIYESWYTTEAMIKMIGELQEPPPIPNNMSYGLASLVALCWRIIPSERANVFQLLKHPYVTKSWADMQQCAIRNYDEKKHAVIAEEPPLRSRPSLIDHGQGSYLHKTSIEDRDNYNWLQFELSEAEAPRPDKEIERSTTLTFKIRPPGFEDEIIEASHDQQLHDMALQFAKNPNDE